MNAGLFIDGGERAAADGRRFEDIDPSSGRPFATVARGGERDVDAAVTAARAVQEAWEAIGPAARGRVLIALAGLIDAHEDELARLETRDTGKPLHEAIDDVRIASAYFRFYGEAVDKVYSDKIPLEGGFALTDRIAHGVTGHITPWNYPLMLLARTLAPALAMGNACVLKPAEDTPLSSIRAAALAIEAGVPAGVLNVVPGMGEEAGAALAAHPGVDHLSFTGSRPVGQQVMEASARRLRPVMLELGGKSPSIVLGDADVEAILPTLRTALLWNNGQTCNAQSRVLVDRSLHDDLVEALAEDMTGLEIGPGLEDRDLGALVSQQQLDRVSEYVDIGKREGARLVIGGRRPAQLPDGYFYEPTIFDVADAASRIAREEVFGPVLAVLSFSSEDEAVALANGAGYDLAAAVWTRDIDRAFRIAGKVRAGQVYVNNWGIGNGVSLPFGGLRSSGFGREKGIAALFEYSACKTTIVRVGG
jgi:aldehyde dehydrogenase (NAD+)